VNAVLKNLEHLGPHEKLQLVEDLWDTIAQEMVPVMSDELHAELQRRAAWADAHPGHELTLDEVARRLGIRL
jgi:putative addiction module component (TIGR02574 family)